jgi:hypothetical protein
VQTSDVATYPSYPALVHACAAHFSVDPDWVLLTNGLDEGILMAAVGHIARTRAHDAETIVPLPAFESLSECHFRRWCNTGADSAASGIRVSSRRSHRRSHTAHEDDLPQHAEQSDRAAHSSRRPSAHR